MCPICIKLGFVELLAVPKVGHTDLICEAKLDLVIPKLDIVKVKLDLTTAVGVL
jgi:hypothetical protein